jgi:hypothetical protein
MIPIVEIFYDYVMIQDGKRFMGFVMIQVSGQCLR